MPAFLKRLWNGWRWIGHKIGHVNGIVILTLFYLLVITPYGWLVRRLGHDPVQTRIDPAEQSYWQIRSTKRPPKSFERPF